MNSWPTVSNKEAEKRLAALAEEYQNVNEQWLNSIDQQQRAVLKRKLRTLEKDIESERGTLDKLESAQSSPRQQYLRWEEHLYKIDFKEAVQSSDKLFAGSRFDREGAVVFLLQNCATMSGELCVRWLQHLLKLRTAELKTYKLDFLPHAGLRLDEHGILQQLASHFDITSTESSLEEKTQKLINKISTSLPNGSIFFLEMRGWDALTPQSRVLNWFLRDFWTPLVEQSQQIRKLPNERRIIRLVAVLAAETSLQDESVLNLIGEMSCPPKQFNNVKQYGDRKIVELRLRNISKEEVRAWLRNFSGLSEDECERWFDYVFHITKSGQPRLVCDALLSPYLR